jgi:cell division protein ZapA
MATRTAASEKAVHEDKPASAVAQSVGVDIYDQRYNLRGVNAEYVQALAATVDAKMRAVAAGSTTVDSLRVAVLAALNLADELAVLKESRGGNTMAKRAGELGDLLDSVLRDERAAG